EGALDRVHGAGRGARHFQGCDAIVPEILVAVYRGHATGPHLAADGVVLGEGRPETFEHIGHGAPKYRPAKTAARPRSVRVILTTPAPAPLLPSPSRPRRWRGPRARAGGRGAPRRRRPRQPLRRRCSSSPRRAGRP